MEDVGRQRAYPPYPWPHIQTNPNRTSPKTVALSIVASLCLVALAVFIQSLDLPFVRPILQSFTGQRRAVGLDSASPRLTPTRSQSQSSSKAKPKQQKTNKQRKIKDNDRAQPSSVSIELADARRSPVNHRPHLPSRAKSAPMAKQANPRRRQPGSPGARNGFEMAANTDKDTNSPESGAPPSSGLSCSNLPSPILNPRAAAYEFRAQYSSTPPAVVEATSSVPEVLPTPVPVPAVAYQPFEALLVIDVEATCATGSSFDYPNEIIVSTSA